ncbi:hypothetical protein BMETH_1271_0 [methanotrophic bacterial endosymbiont of Bathymodiolus sp.]|nr:hypothetical protein BMETH_1271_0 [methanotrophic bacterial endosymbiont of Bathymodiolus sp.]
MSANFCFITHATQRHSDVFSIGRSSNRFAQRGFTHPWRPNQTKNRAIQDFTLCWTARYSRMRSLTFSSP